MVTYIISEEGYIILLDYLSRTAGHSASVTLRRVIMIKATLVYIKKTGFNVFLCSKEDEKVLVQIEPKCETPGGGVVHLVVGDETIPFIVTDCDRLSVEFEIDVTNQVKVTKITKT